MMTLISLLTDTRTIHQKLKIIIIVMKLQETSATMLLFALVVVQFLTVVDASILKCDFETACSDFSSDLNWGITNGLNPRPLDHDHTWNNRTGRYLFFIPQSQPRFSLAEIKMSGWINPSTDRAVCFQLWYYTSTPDLLFTVQLLQGDDLALRRIVAEVEGDKPLVADWTSLQIQLPPEKIKIAIRLNATSGDLVFDDLLVDYCDRPRPSPIETLFECDFETSCDNQLISPSEYPYQWATVEAKTAVAQETQAPGVDYTFGNQSGHYTWLANGNLISQGKVGHLLTRTVFNVTEEQSFCLSFQYYFYGYGGSNNLLVYTSGVNGLQGIWPIRTSSYLPYSKDKWTWGTVNLPVGEYSLLFRMASIDGMRNSFALDNIVVSSCNYSSYSLDPDYSELLSFSAHFDDGTMDGVENAGAPFSVKFNFTLLNGTQVPNPSLGPTYDHTENSSSGGFLYWDRNLPFIPNDNGVINPAKGIQQNLGMCLRFAYYVNSTISDRNATQLSITTGGCYGSTLWSISLDDSQGWQVIKVPMAAYACGEHYYFWASQAAPVEVAVAFDDIEIAQCSSFDPPTTTTTTTTTSTSTTTTTSTSTTSMTTTSTTESLTTITTTSLSTSITDPATTFITTEPTTTATASKIPVKINIQLFVFFFSLMIVKSI